METSHTNVPLVVVAAEARFYFRQELLIEYDRKKMRVWGRWRLQILPNNREDASDQPVSPSCACYLISYIFLINFSGIKVCGGGVSSTLHLQWRGTVWNSNVILNSHRLDANLNLRGGKRKKEKENHETLHVVPYCATCHTDIFTITISILCIPTLSAQMDLFKKTISHHAEENNGKKTRDENSPSARIN